MKLSNILNEIDLDSFMSDLRKASDEVDQERQSQFSKIENSISGLPEFNVMLNIIADKALKGKQKERGALMNPEFPEDTYKNMADLGLLTDRMGLTQKTLDYLKYVASTKVKDVTRKAPDRYHKTDSGNDMAPRAPKDAYKMGNFPPAVRSQLDRMDRKKTRRQRDDFGRQDDEPNTYGEATKRMVAKVKAIIPKVEARLRDKARKR